MEKGETSSLEKIGTISHRERKVQDTDEYDFGGESTLPPPPSLSPLEEKRLYRKIDLRLMPILSLMYLCSFLDRGSLKSPFFSFEFREELPLMVIQEISAS